MRSIARAPAHAVSRSCQRLSGHNRGLHASLRKSSQTQRQVAGPLKVFSQQQTPVVDQLQQVGLEVNELLNGSSIFMVGMMGSGKSSVSKVLSSSLQYMLFDSDQVIEQVTQKTVPQLFEEEGEESFREIESQVMQELSSYKKVIVSTGGGVVARRSNWMYMQQGLVVYLDFPIGVLAERLLADKKALDNRPKLAAAAQDQASMEECLQGIMDERAEFYKQADISVNFHGDDEPVELERAALRVLLKLKQRLEADNQQAKLHNAPEPGDVKIEGAGPDGRIH